MDKNLYVSADSNVKKINFDLRNKVSQRITRNGPDVHIDSRRTAAGQKDVSVSGAKLCYSIPMNNRNSNTIVAAAPCGSNTTRRQHHAAAAPRGSIATYSSVSRVAHNREMHNSTISVQGIFLI